MSVTLISFADKKYFRSQKILKQSALNYGVNKVYSYNEEWLKKQRKFYEENKKILDQKRGAGFWLWKPFIILHQLSKMAEGDILFYVDSGSRFVNDITPIVKIVQKNGIALFSNDNHKNSTWTKRDCFYYMNCDTDEYHKGYQIAACYLALQKNNANIKLVSDWLHFASNERIITDEPNVCGLTNFEDFKDHRHDQSILSLLAIKNKIEIYRDPSQWGNPYKMNAYRVENEFLHKKYVEGSFTNSPYATLIDAHRIMYPLRKWDKLHLLLNKIALKIKS